jgi:hypothetical protein
MVPDRIRRRVLHHPFNARETIMHSYTVVGYAYRADVYDPEHAIQTLARDLANGDNAGAMSAYPDDYRDTPEDWRELADVAGIADPEDERSFDSDRFPKVIFADQVEDDVCAVCGEALI